MKKAVIYVIIVAILSGCSKKDNPSLPPEPLTPKLSSTSVSVEEGQSAELTVTGGKSPYSVTVSPSGIVAATVAGSKLTVTGVKSGIATAVVEGVDGGRVSLSVTVTSPAPPPDPDAAFKADATLRWETVGATTIDVNNTSYTFVSDRGTLFSSSQNKWGHASLDGQRFRLIEWGATPLLRTETGSTPVSSFTVVKEETGTVWLKFSADDTEHRVVAEKL
jgi:hypothetical protein